MKTIGFIDIHPQNRISKRHLAPGQSDAFGNDASAVYLFRESGREYAYERTLAYSAQTDRRNIDMFYVSIPAVMLDFRILNVPFPDKEKITGIIPLELDNLIMGGSGEIVFDSVVIGGDETSLEVLVIYIRKEVLQQVLADLSHSNVDPRVITSLDLGPHADAGESSGRGRYAEDLIGQLSHPREWNETNRIQTAQREISHPSINLRTGSLAYRRDQEKTGKIFKIAAVLALLLVLIVHANILFQTFMIKKEASFIAKEIRMAYGKLFPGEKRTIDELYQLKSHIREMTEKDNAWTGVRALPLLLDLSKRRDSNVIYTDIHIERHLIKMKAEAPSMGDLDKIKMKLSEFLTDVSISDIRPASNGKVVFTVVAKDFIS